MNFEYDLWASMATLVLSVAIVALGRFLVFKVPAFARTFEVNKEENKSKWKEKKGYSGRVKSSQKVALATNLVFFFGLLPFFVTFEIQPVTKILLDIFVILMVYDFFYYMMHRFLFHGKGYFRKVHGVHHQARNPTSMDSLLLHPMEAFLGIALFMVTTVAVALAFGGPFSIVTMVLTNVIYTQINQINHVKFNLDYFPFKTLNWIAHKHSIHHIDMHKGNYATITLFYDKLFGTLD